MYRENPPYGYHGGLFLISRQHNHNNIIEANEGHACKTCVLVEFEFFVLKFLIFLDQLAHRS